MSLALALVQTSPASNPDRNIVKVTFGGTYPVGGDPLPLTAISDPQVLVQVPFTPQNLPVTPYDLNAWLAGYYVEIQRIVTGSGLSAVNTFNLRAYAPGGAEITTAAAYPAGILNGELFIEILCPTVQQ